MKKRLQVLFAGILIGSLLTGGTIFAKTGSELIEVIYSNIKIYIDGIKIDPKTAGGNPVEPFIYNGTTYLPVRAVGEAIGKTVTWDGETQSVYLGEKPGEKQYLVEVCPPYDGDSYEIFKSSEGKFITVAGEKYTNAMTLRNGSYDAYGLFKLNGKYDKLTLEIGRVDDGGSSDATFNVYLDGELEESVDISAEALPRKITIDLNRALQLKLEIDTYYTTYGIINAVLE